MLEYLLQNLAHNYQFFGIVNKNVLKARKKNHFRNEAISVPNLVWIVMNGMCWEYVIRLKIVNLEYLHAMYAVTDSHTFSISESMASFEWLWNVFQSAFFFSSTHIPVRTRFFHILSFCRDLFNL